MPVVYPPDYQPRPRRSDAEILLELDRRTGHIQGEVKSIPLDQASPPPEGKESKSSFNVHVPRSLRTGFQGGCGKNAKARAAGKTP